MRNVFRSLGTVLLVCFSLLESYASMRVSHPQEWRSENPLIQNVEMHIKPKGLFFEYEMYMDISCTNDYYDVADSLEIEYSFSLPENAIIHDSWLWIDDSIIVAQLLDRWTATTIYEGIVDRRQDPSILTKETSTQYELRVYPLNPGKARKIKISFMMPATISSENASAFIPKSLFADIYKLPEDFSIVLHKSDMFSDPILLWTEAEPVEITDVFERYTLANPQFDVNQIVSYEYITKHGVFASVYNGQEKQYYQMAVLDFPKKKEASHYIFVLDNYDIDGFAEKDIVDLLIKYIHLNLEPTDQVSIIYYTSKAQVVTGEASVIAESLPDEMVSQSSQGNGYSLLLQAVKTHNESALPASICFVSNVSEYQQDADWDNTVNWLYETFDTVPPINTIYSYLDYYRNYYWDYYYYENNNVNNYLSEIARRTGGDYYSIDNELDFMQKLETVQQIKQYENFNMHMSFANGFSYDDFRVDKRSANTIQVGRFVGDLPATLELNYLINNDSIHQTSIELTTENTYFSDSMLQKFWAGQAVAELEKDDYSDNDTKRHIIKLSLENRVLSRQTAFLALDPKLNIQPDVCEDCVYDEYSWNVWPAVDFFMTDAPEISCAESSFTVYPQPINENSILKIELAESETISTVRLYNISGEIVREYSADQIYVDELLLSIEDDGTYLLEILTNKSVYNIQLIK